MGATSENIFQKDILNKEATLTLVLLSDSQTGHYFRSTSISPAAPQGKVLTSCLKSCALWTVVTFCSEAVVSGPTGDLLRATHEVAWDYPHRQHPQTNLLNPSAVGGREPVLTELTSSPAQWCSGLGSLLVFECLWPACRFMKKHFAHTCLHTRAQVHAHPGICTQVHAVLCYQKGQAGLCFRQQWSEDIYLSITRREGKQQGEKGNSNV